MEFNRFRLRSIRVEIPFRLLYTRTCVLLLPKLIIFCHRYYYYKNIVRQKNLTDHSCGATISTYKNISSFIM